MKRLCIILCTSFCLCQTVKSQVSVDYQKFLDQYGYIDMTTYEAEMDSNIDPRNGANCNNILLRGKYHAPLCTPSESSPIMNVRLNLIFIQRDDGTGNFQEDDEEQQSLLNDVMTDLNRIISSLVLPGADCFDGTDEDMIHDTRIRFVDNRYYIKKSSLWNNNLHTCDYYKLHADLSNWYLSPIDDSINNVLNDSLKGINIYFTEDSVIYHHFWEVQNPNDTSDVWTGYSTAACSRFPKYNNWLFSSRIQTPCLYSKYWWMKNVVPNMGSYNYPTWENQVRYWFVNSVALSLVHELGHSFNLLHPQDETTYDTFYPTLSCYNTIMNNSGSSPRNFLHPNEIGRMYFNTMSTNLQQYIPTNTYLGVKTLNSQISLPSMRLCYSLLIASGGEVEVPCDMIFSSQESILIDERGILSVSNATLHSVQGEWEGIIVQQGGQLFLSDVTITDYNIVVNSGGSLIIQNGLTLVGDHSIIIKDGGHLCVASDATIELTDDFSTIVVSPYAILGCPSCDEDCILNRTSLINSGDGHFVTYEGSEYLQDITISSDYMATGDSVYAGYDVTTTQPMGDVVINNGGNFRIKANETVLKNNVEVKLGGTLIICK